MSDISCKSFIKNEIRDVFMTTEPFDDIDLSSSQFMSLKNVQILECPKSSRSVEKIIRGRV